MADKLSEEEIRNLARKRVEARKGFFINLTVYIVINAFLFCIWYFVSGQGYPWFLWVLGGWGIGLIFHAINVFAFPKEGGDWERREVDKEMEKIKKSQGD